MTGASAPETGRRKYIIGIDNGSQSTKVTVFDTSGVPVCEGRQALRPNDTPRPGIVEHPDDDLWDSIGAASRQAMAAFRDEVGGDPRDLIGVGLCTIRFCRALLRSDGTLAQPVMSWMDARVSVPHAEDNPEVAYVTTSSGYISHRMTGQFVDTAANYQGCWPMNTDTWAWDTDRIAEFNLSKDMLFDLVLPGERLGEVTAAASAHTGIPAGLPVIATSNDKAVEALGSGLRSPDTLLVSLGTYIASMTTGDRNAQDVSGFWTNFASMPHQYLYESFGIRRGMWTVSWIRDLLGEEIVHSAREAGLSPEDFLNREAAKVPAGSDGLMTVLDWLAPTDATYRKGSFLGFDGRQGRYHMYRSVLEGIALTIYHCGTTMATELDTQYSHLVISGGGSNSDLFMQIFADVFGIPAQRTAINNAAGLGSAICVAVGLGVYDSFDEAMDHMVTVADTFTPDAANHEVYLAQEKVYRSITSFTDEIYRESARVFG